jgi:hypothetical protein
MVLCFFEGLEGIIWMEEVGVDKVGCLVVPKVVACSSAHKSHDILPMEAIMGFVEQPPSGPFTFKDLCWWVELQKTYKHDIETDTIRKRLYVVHVPWVRVPNFMPEEKHKGDVHVGSSRKTTK